MPRRGAGREASTAPSRQGGKDYLLNQLQSRLKPGIAAFDAPRRLFISIQLPPGIDAQAELGALAAALKPYLRACVYLVWLAIFPIIQLPDKIAERSVNNPLLDASI